jgi:hypothetical protein
MEIRGGWPVCSGLSEAAEAVRTASLLMRIPDRVENCLLTAARYRRSEHRR